MTRVTAHQGETLDMLCRRTIGRTDGVIEGVLEMNPGLADLGPILPHGTVVVLPDIAPTQRITETIQLWT